MDECLQSEHHPSFICHTSLLSVSWIHPPRLSTPPPPHIFWSGYRESDWAAWCHASYNFAHIRRDGKVYLLQCGSCGERLYTMFRPLQGTLRLASMYTMYTEVCTIFHGYNFGMMTNWACNAIRLLQQVVTACSIYRILLLVQDVTYGTGNGESYHHLFFRFSSASECDLYDLCGGWSLSNLQLNPRWVELTILHQLQFSTAIKFPEVNFIPRYLQNYRKNNNIMIIFKIVLFNYDQIYEVISYHFEPELGGHGHTTYSECLYIGTYI